MLVSRQRREREEPSNENFGRDCWSCSRWASATIPSATCARRRARSRVDQRRPRVQIRPPAARLRREDVSGKTGPLDGEDVIDTILAQPVTAVRVREDLPELRRDEVPPVVRAAGRTFRRADIRSSRCSNASSCRRTSTARRPRLPRSRVPLSWCVHYKRWPCASCRRFRFRRLTAGLGGAVRSAQRRRMGGGRRGSRLPRCCSAATCSATSSSLIRKRSARPTA